MTKILLDFVTQKDEREIVVEGREVGGAFMSLAEELGDLGDGTGPLFCFLSAYITTL